MEKESLYMKKIIEIFLLLGIVFLFSVPVIAASEDESPIDKSRLEFTTLEESILIPESEIIVEPGKASRYVGGTVIGDGVRLRSEPSTSAPVLELMYYGERVVVDDGYVALVGLKYNV